VQPSRMLTAGATALAAVAIFVPVAAADTGDPNAVTQSSVYSTADAPEVVPTPQTAVVSVNARHFGVEGATKTRHRKHHRRHTA
jgi:hypothetical protein